MSSNTTSPCRRATGALALSAMVVAVLAGTAVADNVDRPPVATVTGARTLLTSPASVVTDAAGRTYVSDPDSSAVLVFARTADGDAAPVRTITGPDTLLSAPQGMVLDADGRLHVANRTGSRVVEFLPGAHGNAAPDDYFEPGMQAVGLAIDSRGRVYVSDGVGTIKVFARGASGSPEPLRTVTGPDTGLVNAVGLAIDAQDRLWVANGTDASVLMFAAGAAGNAAPQRTIAGPSTGLVRLGAVTLDALGRVYVTSRDNHTVAVFAAGADGDVAPVRMLSGLSTGLDQPLGIDVVDGNALSVSDFGNDALLRFSALFPPTKPARPARLVVGGAAGAARRPVTWTIPSDGGSHLTGFRLRVEKAGRVILRRDLTSAASTTVLRRGTLSPGRLELVVQARNAKGWGPAARTAFRVAR